MGDNKFQIKVTCQILRLDISTGCTFNLVDVCVLFFFYSTVERRRIDLGGLIHYSA